MQKALDQKAGSGDMCLSCHDGSVVDSRFKVWSTRHHTTDAAPSSAVKIPVDTFPLDANGHMTCATCHTAHALPDSCDISTVIFLRRPNVDSSLCLACHADHAAKNKFQHPVGRMKDPIPQSIVAAGGKTSSDGHMVFCQTCHEPHGARNAWMLVLPPAQLCVACHPEKNMPESPTIAGSSVHHIGQVYHGFEPPATLLNARAIFGAKGELGCMSCHRLHDAASNKSLLIVKNEKGSFCIECHKDKQGIQKSKHDPATSEWGKKLEFVSGGPCVDCHPIHGPRDKGVIWQKIANKEKKEQLCEICHQSGGLGKPVHSLHFGKTLTLTPQVPLDKPVLGRDKRLICSSCHDIHQISQNQKLLKAGRQDSALCLACHFEMKGVLGTLHDLRNSVPDACNVQAETAAQSGPCGGCHVEHQASTETGGDSFGKSFCVDCHRQGGSAATLVPKYMDHPDVDFVNRTMPQQAGYMPTFNYYGKPSPTGAISCLTCHEPHAGGADAKVKAGSALSRHAFLRPAKGQSLCVDCHGGEALWRYLYYHKEHRRPYGGK